MTFIRHCVLISVLCLIIFPLRKQYDLSSASPRLKTGLFLLFTNSAGASPRVITSVELQSGAIVPECYYSGSERGSLCAVKTSPQWMSLFVLRKIINVLGRPKGGEGMKSNMKMEREWERERNGIKILNLIFRVLRFSKRSCFKNDDRLVFFFFLEDFFFFLLLKSTKKCHDSRLLQHVNPCQVSCVFFFSIYSISYTPFTTSSANTEQFKKKKTTTKLWTTTQALLLKVFPNVFFKVIQNVENTEGK